MQRQPNQSGTPGNFIQSSFPFCRRHCSTFIIHSVIFTLSPEESEWQIPCFQATSHLEQKAIRNQNTHHHLGCCLHAQTLLPPKPLIKMLLSACSWIPATLCFPITLTCAAPIPFPQNVLIGWSNQHPPASVRQDKSMNIL